MNIFYQTLCRLRPLFFGLPLLLAASTVSSCSGDIADNLASAPSPAPAAPADSILKFATIEDFEAMTASEIPGEYADYQLNSLSYECVDTIEFRALLLDVTARLTSPAGVKKDVIFKAEVGPELVSVEYVPGGEMIPAHHNFTHMFYAKVDRYRNYSDGSRVGPDTFYDYGHPIFLRVSIYGNEGDLGGYGALNGNPAYLESVVPWRFENEYINPEAMYYENGVFHYYDKYEAEMNLNAVVIGPDGTIATGEDFLLKEALSYFPGMSDFQNFTDNYSRAISDYYNYYIPDRLASPDEEFNNLCRDVPDVSKNPFPHDTNQLTEGWYFLSVTDKVEGYDFYLSNYMRKCSSWDSSGAFFSHTGSQYFNDYHLQYLVIDGRIIHFADMMSDYQSCYVAPKHSITKTANGYNTRLVVDTKIYGEKFKVTSDIEYKGVNGPRVVYDLSDYFKINGNDDNEMNNLSETRSNEPTYVSEKKSFSEKNSMPREDGKTFEFDRSLPKSIGNLSRTRTIYPKTK